MKLFKGFKIDIVSVLGVIGLLLTVLCFLSANLSGDSVDRVQQVGPYSLFYRLYKNLGYRLKKLNATTLPNQQGDLLIYLDCNPNKEDLNNLINQWVKPGGSLLIAGINDDYDPFCSAKVNTSRVNSIYIKKESRHRQTILKPNGKQLKHLPENNDWALKNAIVFSEQGPLLYHTTQGAGSIYVLTESDLLKISYLREEKVAIFFNDLFKPYFHKRIYLIYEVPTRTDQAIPVLTLLFKDKMFFVTMQLIWIMLLFVAWQGKRFGQPQLMDPYRKRTLSEHLKAVANFYQKTRSLKIIDHINLEYFKFKLDKIMGRRFKSNGDPKEFENLIRYLGTVLPDISEKQIRFCFSETENLMLNQIQNKERIRNIILKSLKRERQRINLS